MVRELLGLFNLAGKTITADAMHCSRDTAEKIIQQGGDYVLALKGNQGTTLDEISSYIEDCVADPAIEVAFAETREKNRDRVEHRECWKAPSLDWMLDVLFEEDFSRLQNENTHQILNVMRKSAIALHQKYIASLPTKTKPTIKRNMLRAALNGHMFLDVLRGGYLMK
jgi:predicted transposase YbfD/YdcC